MTTHIKNAVKNSYFVLFLSAIGIAVGYALRIFLSKSLTIEDFGLFYSVSAFVGLFTIVRYIGLDRALVKFIPEFLIKRENNKIKSSVILVLIVQSITILTFTAFIFIFHDTISASLFRSDKAGIVLILMTLSFLPSMFFTVFQSVFQGYQKLKTYAIVEPVRISLTFIFSLLFIRFGVMGVALAYISASIVTSIIFLFCFSKLGITNTKINMSTDLTKKLFRFSIPVFMSSIALIIINYTDTLIITFFRTLEEVALYQVALPTTQLLLVFSSAIAAVILPLTSHLYSNKRLTEIERGIRVISVMLLFILLPFVILLYSFPEIVIQILFSREFLPAVNTIKILSISMIFYSFFVVFQTTLDGIGRPFINTKIMFAMALSNIIMNLLLVPVLGIMGSAIAFGITFLIGMLAGWIYVRKYLNISLAYSRMVKIFVASVISAAVTYLVKVWLNTSIYEEFVVALAIGWFVFIVLVSISKSITIDDIEFIESKSFHMPNTVKKMVKFIFRRRK